MNLKPCKSIFWWWTICLSKFYQVISLLVLLIFRNKCHSSTKFQVHIHFHWCWCYFVCNSMHGSSCRWSCKWLLPLLCILILVDFTFSLTLKFHFTFSETKLETYLYHFHLPTHKTWVVLPSTQLVYGDYICNSFTGDSNCSRYIPEFWLGEGIKNVPSWQLHFVLPKFLFLISHINFDFSPFRIYLTILLVGSKTSKIL